MIPEIEPGTVIHDRYQIQKLLGKGGFGRTYLALDSQRFDESCVLKEFVPTASKEENLCKSKDLFEREAKVLYQIQHPQVPKFLAWFTDNQRIFIVQEYIDGKTYSEILSERVAQKGEPFSEIEVRTWLLDLLPVLEYLHDRKIIHRDISLENVMLPHNQSKPVLIDFGVVKENFTQVISPDSLNSDNSLCTSIVGKFGYSPPEQLLLGYSHPSNDIYALGVCAVVLLTGKMPPFLFDESLNWQWRSQVNICDAFTIILEKMLAEKPVARFQTVQEILLDLNKIESNSPVLTSFNFKILSPIEAIKIRKHEKETQKALEELLILQGLEQKLRQSYGKNIIHLQNPIYLNLDLSDYIKQKSTVSAERPTHVSITLPAIATKVNDFFTKKIPKQILINGVSNNKIPIQVNTQEVLEKPYITNNLQFLEIIKQDFANLIGPIAIFMINETLKVFPDCSLKQLIEIVAAEIPDKLTAEQFHKDIYNLIESKLYLLPQTE